MFWFQWLCVRLLPRMRDSIALEAVCSCSICYHFYIVSASLPRCSGSLCGLLVVVSLLPGATACLVCHGELRYCFLSGCREVEGGGGAEPPQLQAGTSGPSLNTTHVCFMCFWAHFHPPQIYDS